MNHPIPFPAPSDSLPLPAFLAKECEAIGLQSVSVDAYGYVTALLPGNTANAPTIGFISHMDTSPDASGENVLSNIVENYDGKAIPLNGTVLSPKEFPSLKEYIGQTLITSDGTTLLGADDKAGIAEILTAAEYLLAHPEIPHGDIRIAFTPDEEIGKGVDFFDVDKFHAISPTRWMAAASVSWNMKTSMRHAQSFASKGKMYIPALQKMS